MSLTEAMAGKAAAPTDGPALWEGASRLDELLTAALDAVLECQLRQQHALRVVQEAVRQFELVDAEWHAELASLHRRLLELTEGLRLGTDLDKADRRPPGSDGSPSPRPGVQLPAALPALAVTCFGQFQVVRAGRPVELCRNRNGRTILRYLVAQPRHRATMDALMGSLWPGARRPPAPPTPALTRQSRPAA